MASQLRPARCGARRPRPRDDADRVGIGTEAPQPGHQAGPADGDQRPLIVAAIAAGPPASSVPL